MSTITLKNVPAAVHRALKARARAHGRSLNREIIATVESSLGSARLDGTAIGRHARAARESLSIFVTDEDLTTFRNAGRP